MLQSEYPILEFDPQPAAIIEPTALVSPVDIAEHCVICFFQEVLDAVIQSGRARQVTEARSEMGAHPIYETEWEGRRFAFLHPGVGAPLAIGILEEAIARGCRKFIACGGAGVLDREIAVGHIVIPTAAVRDEGVSYHYMPPSREVAALPEAVAAIEQTLARHGLPFVEGKTWTTDAFYRETPAKVQRRRAEGCLTVEMEAAAFFAVARFREVQLGQMLYGGDDVSGSEWDGRAWNRHSIRERLFWLSAEACLSL